MRSLLGGLVLILLPSLASAECQCVCVQGRSMPVCQPQAMVEPICQQICPDKVEQSLGAIGIGGGGMSEPRAPASSGGITQPGIAAGGNDQSTSDVMMGR